MSEDNRMKTYEAAYLRGSYRQGVANGLFITTAFQYQDRQPLENKTDYTWRDKADREYTPNYPLELLTQNITRHQSLVGLLGISWQPGTKYIELPDRKINIGSKMPVFDLVYIQTLGTLFSNDADFSKWKFTMADDLNFHLQGKFSYKLGVGGFLNSRNVEVPDYMHFNGNLSTFATEYKNSFQLLPIYDYSNTANFYSLAHIEHNFNGF
ncbi:MAG: hypothetical protein IPF69_10370 [Chitinophagaceae bacterium]|nr:hypothetical protein [Chitinophagaceae bacterium]